MKKKGFGARCVESLLFLTAADLGALLVKFFIQMLAVPVRRELDARQATEALNAVSAVLAGLTLVGFFAILAVFIGKNPVYRGRYLNATVGKEYDLSADLRQTVAERFLPDLLMTALMGIPLYAVLLFVGDVNYLPTLFSPFYAVWELIHSPIADWIILSAAVPLFNLAVTLIAHRLWEKNRLRK